MTMTPDDQQPAERLPIHPTTDDDQGGDGDGDALKPVSPDFGDSPGLPGSPGSPAAAGSTKPIRDLKPGEPPPESSAGS